MTNISAIYLPKSFLEVASLQQTPEFQNSDIRQILVENVKMGRAILEASYPSSLQNPFLIGYNIESMNKASGKCQLEMYTGRFTNSILI